jgi:hypothetical protein
MTTNGTVTTPPRRSDFASGAAVRLDLPGSDRWVLVRAELSYGQQRRLAMAGVTGMPAALAGTAGEARLSVDWAVFEIERLVTWVMDWSFRDGDGDRVAVSREAIEALHPDTAQEITAALDTYLEAQEGKKAPAPAASPNSAATSPSAKRSAGAGSS